MMNLSRNSLIALSLLAVTSLACEGKKSKRSAPVAEVVTDASADEGKKAEEGTIIVADENKDSAKTDEVKDDSDEVVVVVEEGKKDEETKGQEGETGGGSSTDGGSSTGGGSTEGGSTGGETDGGKPVVTCDDDSKTPVKSALIGKTEPVDQCPVVEAPKTAAL